MSEPFTFAERLKGFRQRAAITQKQLADSVRRGRTTISAWERGLYLPENRDIVLELAETLSLSPTETDQLLAAAGYAISRGSPEVHGTPNLYVEDAHVKRLVVDGTVLLGRHSLLVPFQTPPLPAHFVPRPDVMGAIQHRLLGAAQRGENGSTQAEASNILVVSAIHGLGGIGKSTLAAAVAHASEVRAHFHDGILWATLGQQPDVLALVSGWIQALGDYNFKPTSVEAASAHLRTLLQDKTVLLIVDDVWASDHARPFLVRGPQCRVLITTREAVIARAVDAAIYSLDVMTPEQALALLEGRLNHSLGGPERDSALALTQAVGYLPLALELAAAQVADGITWIELLTDIRAEVARLESLSIPGAEDVTDEMSRKRLSLLASFNLSLSRLPDARRRQFAWLGVLPEDVSLSAGMARTLWDTDLRTARDSLRYLRDKALLLPGVVLPDESPTYRLHDLLHDLARRLLTLPVPEGLGLTLPHAHAALLDRYRSQSQEGHWSTLPNDGYIHQYLTWHMEKAEQPDLIHTLLAEETPEGRNAWYEAQERLGQMASYLTDVARAWRLADVSLPPLKDKESSGYLTTHTFSKIISLQCRYALITTSLISMAQNIERQLLVNLVKAQVWTPEQAFAYVRQSPMDMQSEVLPELLQYLPETLIKQALALARMIDFEWSRASTLAVLATHFSGPSREELLLEALAIARSIDDTEIRAKALVDLVPYLQDVNRHEVLAEALDVARGMDAERERGDVVIQLIPYLPGQLLDKALMVIREIDDKLAKVEALAALVPHLSDKTRSAVLEEAWILVEKFDDRLTSNRAMIALAKCLADLDRGDLALTIAQGIGYEWPLSEALVAIVPHLSEEQLYQTLTVARKIKDEAYRVEVLAAIASRLPSTSLEDVLIEALDATARIDNALFCSRGLEALAPLLTEAMLEQAVSIARNIDERFLRASSLTFLAAYLPKPVQAEVLSEVLTTLRPIEDEVDGFNAIASLALHLPSEVHDKVLSMTLARTSEVKSELQRANSVIALAPNLTPPLLDEALAITRTIISRTSRASLLAGIVPYLPEEMRNTVLQEALAMGKEIEDKYYKVKLLVGLIPYVPDKLQVEMLTETLQIAQTIGDEFERADALSLLAPLLSRSLLYKALRAMQTVKSSSARKMHNILPYLAERGQQFEALELARKLEDGEDRAKALAALVPYLVEPTRNEVLMETLTAMRVPAYLRLDASVLELLAPHLPQSILMEELSTAQLTNAKRVQIETRAILLPYLSNRQVVEELVTAREVINGERRAALLKGVAPYLAKLDTITLYLVWLDTLHIVATRARSELLRDLGALSSVLLSLGGSQTIVETIHAIEEVTRWWP